MARPRYDGLRRRIEYIRFDVAGDPPANVTTRYYYDGQNVIAEYTYDPGTATESIARTYINGTQYIDERAVMRNYVMTEEHPTVRDHYYLLKDLYTVAGLAGSNGALEEAYVYDTYGYARIYQWSYADIDRDGDFDQQTDQAWVANHYSPFLGSGTDARSDVDMNGVINAADESKMLADPNGGVPVLIAYSGLGNPYFFTGRITETWHAGNPNDPDDITVAGDPDGFRRMQDNRNRMYDPKHGRWLQRDPLGVRPDVPWGLVEPRLQHQDGMNVYEYVKSAPIRFPDPLGYSIMTPVVLGAPRDLAHTWWALQKDG